MIRAITMLFTILILACAACGKSVYEEYEDSLTLGTGLVDGGVTGTSGTFIIPAQANEVIVHWALESRYEMGGGQEIAILLEKKTGDDFVERQLIYYPEIDATGIYYLIDSFSHILGTGTFRATAIVGFRKVASKQYTVRLE